MLLALNILYFFCVEDTIFSKIEGISPQGNPCRAFPAQHTCCDGTVVGSMRAGFVQVPCSAQGFSCSEYPAVGSIL